MTTYLLNGKHHDYQLKIAVPDQSPQKKGIQFYIFWIVMRTSPCFMR